MILPFHVRHLGCQSFKIFSTIYSFSAMFKACVSVEFAANHIPNVLNGF